MELMTAAEMKAADRFAIDEIGIPSLVLMENAGRKAAEVVRERFAADSQVVCVVGRGNNGGDGLVSARYLHLHGFGVTVVLLSGERKLSADAELNLRPVVNLGLPIINLEQETRDEVRAVLSAADVIVDALFGTGVRGELSGLGKTAVMLMNEVCTPVVSIDLPSGLDADTGQFSCSVRADVTVTLGYMKRGLVLHPGADVAGKVIVADIGLPRGNVQSEAVLVDIQLARRWLPSRSRAAHKGDCGRVLVVGGSRGYSGAAILAARSVLRSGAGLCYLAGPESLNNIFESSLPEVITVPIAESEGGTVSAGAVNQVLSAAEHCDVVAVGPGLGRSDRVRAFLIEVVSALTCPVVIDADRLQAWEGQLDLLEPGAVITPHPGEMARLLGVPISDVMADMIGCAHRASTLMKGTCLLKGAASVTAGQGFTAVSSSGTSAMATAGMGDVLTGVVASLIAQGTEIPHAAAVGSFIHGLAGKQAEFRLGPRGILAGDVCEVLPAAIKLLTGKAGARGKSG